MLDETRRRLLGALDSWTDDDVLWLVDSLERGAIAPGTPEGDEEACGGPSACHGSMQFCDSCGDVSEACDDDACELHHCQACGALAKRDGEVVYCAPCREYLAEQVSP